VSSISEESHRLVQIVARENDCFFLNITSDLLRHKEYGRTEKVVAAIFTLAAKLWKLQQGTQKRPAIIFLDEVDTILGGGENSLHECFIAARSIFAQKWDGIHKTPGMIVIGTTNYPGHLPAFIYRRFQTRTEVICIFINLRQLLQVSQLGCYGEACQN
jgi:ATPase family AAA domain-containing protein 1